MAVVGGFREPTCGATDAHDWRRTGTGGTVELNTSPEQVLEAIGREIRDYPEEDRDAIANLSF